MVYPRTLLVCVASLCAAAALRPLRRTGGAPVGGHAAPRLAPVGHAGRASVVLRAGDDFGEPPKIEFDADALAESGGSRDVRADLKNGVRGRVFFSRERERESGARGRTRRRHRRSTSAPWSSPSCYPSSSSLSRGTGSESRRAPATTWKAKKCKGSQRPSFSPMCRKYEVQYQTSNCHNSNTNRGPDCSSSADLARPASWRNGSCRSRSRC